MEVSRWEADENAAFWTKSRPVLHADFVLGQQRSGFNGLCGQRREYQRLIYYIKFLEQVRRTGRKPQYLPYWILHDNAPIHSAGRTKCSMQELGFETLMHPPYSPDLAPSDFFLFRHLKKHLCGQRFQTKDALRHSVEEYFEGLPLDHFRTAFDELVIRVQKCIDCGGGYIEKWWLFVLK